MAAQSAGRRHHSRRSGMSDTEMLAAFRIAPGIVYNTVHIVNDEDLIQEAREAMWLASKSWRPEHNCSRLTWMSYKARFRVIDAYRVRIGVHGKGERRGQRLSIVSMENLPEVGVDIDFGAQLEADALHDVIAKQCARLSARDSDIVLGFFAGRPQWVAADMHGISAGRAAQIVSRFQRQIIPLVNYFEAAA